MKFIFIKCGYSLNIQHGRFVFKYFFINLFKWNNIFCQVTKSGLLPSNALIFIFQKGQVIYFALLPSCLPSAWARNHNVCANAQEKIVLSNFLPFSETGLNIWDFHSCTCGNLRVIKFVGTRMYATFSRLNIEPLIRLKSPTFKLGIAVIKHWWGS